MTCLVEKTEAHVLVGLFLLLLLLLSGSLLGSTTGSGSTSSSGSTTASAARWHGGELLGSLSDQLQTVSQF